MLSLFACGIAEFEPCEGQERFDIIMCKSHMCTSWSLEWCTANPSGMENVKQALLESKSPRIAKIASLVQAENAFEVVTELGKMLEVIEEEGKADKENLDWCNEERTENHGLQTPCESSGLTHF